MANQNTRDFKWIWIPKEIWLNEKLTLQEKVFLVEIDSLDNMIGCYANNDYFARFFWISKTRVSLVIKSLIDKWFLESEIIEEEWNRRILKVKDLFNKTEIGSLTNIKEGLKQKLKHNNTINNTSNNINILSKDNIQKSEDFWGFNFSQEFKDIFSLYEKHRKEKKSKLTQTAKLQLFKKVLGVGEKIAIQKIQESITNWRTWVFFDKKLNQNQNKKPKMAYEENRDFNFLD